MTKTYYRRNLPHITPEGGLFFITARLTDTLPPHLLKEWQAKKEAEQQAVRAQYAKSDSNTGKQSLQIAEERKQLLTNIQKRYFKTVDDYLDQAATGEKWLQQPAVAEVLQNKCHQYDKQYYNLLAYCIMLNHFHLLIDTDLQLSENAVHSEYTPLSKIMNYIKGGSAFEANKILNRKGRFWQPESYDHLVRNEKEFYNIVRYIANNPVKARLVQNWYEWPFTYVEQELLGIVAQPSG
jgi:REP element-mobilizing transposase RayT